MSEGGGADTAVGGAEGPPTVEATAAAVSMATANDGAEDSVTDFDPSSLPSFTFAQSARDTKTSVVKGASGGRKAQGLGDRKPARAIRDVCNSDAKEGGKV